MPDRDFVLGVLAAQAGFVTPAQVIAAGSARMLARDGRSVLDHLVDSGALTPERRDIVVDLANEALAASGGTPEQVLESLPGARALARTLGSELPADAAAASPSPGDGDLVPVEREGQYARLDELGRGGQSIVWRALDRFVGREVALKELTWPGAEKSSGSTRAAQARFLREARLTAQLDHPGIVAVHELARRPDGTLYSAQKLVRGRTLKAALAQCRTLSQRLEMLPHLVAAAQAMAYAHGRSVVHRDLKPSNVMVGPYGETVVVDWGLAKRRGEAEAASPTPTPDSSPELTQAGVALGTPSYMSPEQARGDLETIDERSDVFSLGAMLYELLTGRPPFQGLDNAQVIEAVRSGHIVPVRVVCPEAPPELAAIAERALRRNPAERYPDAAAFASELLAYRAGARVEAYAYGSLELARKFVQRNPALSVAVAASVLILIGAAIAVALQLRQARVNLASALIERARRAEDVSDWARAAAYYAASRVQNDTAAARWGIALARERMPERGTRPDRRAGRVRRRGRAPRRNRGRAREPAHPRTALRGRLGSHSLDGTDRGTDQERADLRRKRPPRRRTFLAGPRRADGTGTFQLGPRSGAPLQGRPCNPSRSHRLSGCPSGGGDRGPGDRGRAEHSVCHLPGGGPDGVPRPKRSRAALGPGGAAGDHLPVCAGRAGDRLHRTWCGAGPLGVTPALRRRGRRLLHRASRPIHVRTREPVRGPGPGGQRGRSPGGGGHPHAEPSRPGGPPRPFRLRQCQPPAGQPELQLLARRLDALRGGTLGREHVDLLEAPPRGAQSQRVVRLTLRPLDGANAVSPVRLQGTGAPVRGRDTSPEWHRSRVLWRGSLR